MNGLEDVDGFKICIQVCVWLGFPPLYQKSMGNGLLLGMVCSYDLGSNWPSYMYFFHYFERNTKYYIQHFAACVLSVKIWYWSGKHYANIYLYKYMMLRLHPFADYAIHSNNGINLISDLNVKDKFRLLIVLCIVTAKYKIDK